MGKNQGEGWQGRYHGGSLLGTSQTGCRCRQNILYAAGRSLTITSLVLVGSFNLPNVCWKHSTAERKQSRTFLKCVKDNLLTQLVKESARKGSLLDLLFTNREGLVGDAGHSDHKMIVFNSQASKDGCQLNCELGLQWGRHGFLRNLADRVRR